MLHCGFMQICHKCIKYKCAYLQLYQPKVTHKYVLQNRNIVVTFVTHIKNVHFSYERETDRIDGTA